MSARTLPLLAPQHLGFHLLISLIQSTAPYPKRKKASAPTAQLQMVTSEGWWVPRGPLP